MKLLVIGSQGFIGNEFVAYFQGQPTVEVVTTSHRPGADFHLDLEEQNPTLPADAIKDVDYAIICSFLSNLEQCKNEPERSRKINVDNLKVVLNQVIREGITPIFLSSDLVFEGTTGNYSETSPRNPSTIYGQQKMAIEDFLAERASKFIILRLSKIYSLQHQVKSMLHHWIEQWEKGISTPCVHDQIITLTLAEELPPILFELLKKNQSGTFHISTTERKSRYLFALQVAEILGYPKNLVKKVSLADFEFKEKRPQNNTLNTSKVQNITKITPSELSASTERIHGLRRHLVA